MRSMGTGNCVQGRIRINKTEELRQLHSNLLFHCTIASSRLAVVVGLWTVRVDDEGGYEDGDECAVRLGCRELDELMRMVSCGA